MQTKCNKVAAYKLLGSMVHADVSTNTAHFSALDHACELHIQSQIIVIAVKTH